MSHRFVWMLGLGAACGALGCSDPVPQAAAAGLSANIGICPTQGMSRVTLGNPEPDRFRVSGSASGKPVYSGESGANISCSVRGSGTFTINGKVDTDGLSFSVNGTASSEDGRGTAEIRLYTRGIGQNVSQTDCLLSVVETSGNGYQVKNGAVWAAYTCSGLKAPPTLNCTASGEFLLERCAD